MYARKGRRWFHRMLAAVDPSDFADSVEDYIGTLPSEQVRALAVRTADSLPAAERTQLELYIDPKSLTAPGDDLLARRFTAFLRQNPRAVEHLGPEALQQIFLPLENPKTVALSRRRFSLNALCLGVLAVLVAVVPLAAQYAHQRGMLTGLTDATMIPPFSVAHVRRVALQLPAPPHVASHRPSRHAPSHAAPRARVAIVRRTDQSKRRVAQSHAGSYHASRARRIAAQWKFDRRNYKYFSPAAHSLSERARFAVQSYLNALIAGNTRSALAHLGLPPDADLVNLSEVPIVTRRSHARVVWVKPQADGKTQVDADIRGRRGEYFEVFYVAADGPAVRITDRYYIPVGGQATR